MREDKKLTPSPQKNGNQSAKWVWPTVYATCAIAFVGMIWGYNVYVSNEDELQQVSYNAPESEGNETTIETNAATEALKYPFDEALHDQVQVVQDYYDVTASDESRENSLLVFNQTYVTNQGVSLSIGNEPFEVRAAMSGEVVEVNSDPFMGDEVVISHQNGLTTHYRSVTEVAVKKGDRVTQGQTLGTATANEWNPSAGVHLLFEVYEKGEAVNPNDYLAF